MTPLTPQRLAEITRSNASKADCSVAALVAVTGLSYGDAEKLAARTELYKGGTAKGQGMMRGGCELVLDALGLDHRQVDPTNHTPATFSYAREYGAFLLYVSGHVMGLVDGELYNARGSSGKPLQQITEVIR